MASRGINKVILVGNLGADPEMKYLPSGDAICNLRLATSEAWKDKATGEQKETTEWHRVVAYGRLAQIMGEYLRKGSQVYVEGSLRTRKWQGEDGKDRYSTEIRANEMQMLGGKGGGSASFDNNDNQASSSNQNSYAPRSAPSRSGPPTSAPASSAPMHDESFDGGFDDDIPF